MKITPVDGSTADSGTWLDQRLSPQEDDELRRLHYMGTQGMLSERMRERLLVLRVRDRRDHIRSPREFGEDRAARESRKGPSRRNLRFLRRG